MKKDYVSIYMSDATKKRKKMNKYNNNMQPLRRQEFPRRDNRLFIHSRLNFSDILINVIYFSARRRGDDDGRVKRSDVEKSHS